MFTLQVKREFKALWLRRSNRVTVALFLVLCAWALLLGLRWQTETQAVLAATPADMLTDRNEWLADLESIESGEESSPYSARPMNLTFLAVHEPGELSALAFRAESIHPHTTLINGWRSEASLFSRYEVQGPVALRAGILDMAFVVLVILPLLLLALSFDVLSRERESRRFLLFLAQGGNPAQLVAARVLAVSLTLLLIATAGILGMGLIQNAPLDKLGLWIASLWCYGFFWAGLAACVAVLSRRSVTGALAVLATWSVLVVFIPSGAQFLAQALYPLPSKVAYLSEARDAEGETRRNLAQRAEIYMAEHPGQGGSSDEDVPGFYRAAYLANVDINEKTTPMVQALERRQSAQRELVAIAGLFSPVLGVQRAVETASGTGPARAAEFRSQARAYLRTLLESIGPATVSKSRMTSADARAIPEFRFEPARSEPSVFLGLLWAGFLGAAAVAFAWRRALRLP